MISHNEMLAEMRERAERDPSGSLLAQWVVDQKQLGLTKSDAKELLTALMTQFQQVRPRTNATEELEESVAGVLDRVVGWCSHDHIIFPEDGHE